MVEGIREGVVIGGAEGVGDDKKQCAGIQDFHNADIIVIDNVPHGAEPSKLQCPGEKTQEVCLFQCWAIYGSAVVSSTIDEVAIRQLRNDKVKLVWSFKKPYILNGD